MKIVSRPSVSSTSVLIDEVVDLLCQVFSLNPNRQTSDDYRQIANGCLSTLVVQGVVKEYAIMPVRGPVAGHSFTFSIQLVSDPIIYDVNLTIH